MTIALGIGGANIMTEQKNPLNKWLGWLLLVAAGLLTANNLYFAADPVAATPLFNYVDVVVLVGFAATIAEIIRSRGGAVPLCTFAITAHLYAYNYIAKVSESGLENPTIWLLIDPVAAALFLYKGLRYLRSS